MLLINFFLFYAVVCLIVFLVSCSGLFFGYCYASFKDRHTTRSQRKSYLQMFRILVNTRSKCEKLQNTLQQDKTKFRQSLYNFVTLQKNVRNVPLVPYFPPIIAIHRCWDTFDTIKQELSIIQERLKLPTLEPNDLPKKAPLFLFSCMSMIGLLLLTQTLTALLCLFLFGAIGASLIAGSATSNAYIQRLTSKIFQSCNIDIADLLNPSPSVDLTFLEISVWVIITISFLILSILLINRIIRFVVSQCEILIMGIRISVSILRTDLTENQITEKFEQMFRNIQMRDPTNYISRLLHRILD